MEVKRENQEYLSTDKHIDANRQTRRKESTEWIHESNDLEESYNYHRENRRLYEVLGIIGKTGAVYFALKGFSLFAEASEVDPANISIHDWIGFSMLYIGGCCWGAAKLWGLDERSARRDYEKALSKIQDKVFSGKDLLTKLREWQK
jgi:hypothetical protein